LAGWSRSADFELALDGWAGFGLSRFSASRGLDELTRAGLVSVSRKPGRSPVVTILEANAPHGCCCQEGSLMPRIRYRLRTIMIAIAALAILMFAIRIAAPFLSVKGIWVHMVRLNVVVESFDWAPGFRFTPTPGTSRDDFHVAIPLLQLVITAPWVIFWSFVFLPVLRTRLANGRRKVTGASSRANRSIDRQPGTEPKRGAGGSVG
jgi:hypothetical protein